LGVKSNTMVAAATGPHLGEVMSSRLVRPFLITAAVAGLAACATGPTAGPAPALASTAFSTADFAWSAAPGAGAVEGRIAFRQNGRAYSCTGSVALTPVTPYTRARFQTLYGSTERAALPESVVRARTVPDPNADYRSFVRPGVCADGRFRVEGLPDGAWFIIAPVSAEGAEDRVVLMRRVQVSNGRTVQVTL
jgi:hypothetical protein